jgi:hypothetical protein
MRFLSEKMYSHSDGYYIYICGNCSSKCIVNHERQVFICTHCKGDADIKEIPCSWASNLALNEISAMNIGMKLHLQPYRMEIAEKDYHDVRARLESVIEAD